ncbi:hypothetical protein BG006_007315 [Podila minutissima]|uniref:Transmembrane protein n=1 Tax=Podila minutissima TaxID=64525 RepID=A0A9P5SKE8_9FUNG|nr:hypothetical protein BG006_007315 [Podila minutissima]
MNMDVPHNPSLARNPFRLLLLSTALAIFLWIARQYPEWKAEKLAANASIPDMPKDTLDTTNLNDNTTDSSQQDPSQASTWPSSFSLRWIPYLPFAVVYLVAKALWTALRFLILHLIYAAELSSLSLLSGLEDLADWTVNHGADFVHQTLITPLRAAFLAVCRSPALAKARVVIEETVAPAVVASALKCQALTASAATKVYSTMQHMAEPVTRAVEWFARECLYTMGLALYARLKVVGLTFVQTTKIYLGELAKDALDLGRLLLKVGQWIWARTLQSVGRHLYALGELVVNNLLAFLPWLAGKVYSILLRPVGHSLVEGFKILWSHPTLLGGLHALSAKVREKGGQALEKLESVNWLVLLETVLTKAVTVTDQDICRGHCAECVRVARPVVEWVIAKFLMIVHPLWQVVSWISWAVFTNTKPALALLHQKIVLPSIAFWESKIVPALGVVASGVIAQARVVSRLVIRMAPAVAAALGPMWGGIVKVMEAIQKVAELALQRVGVLSSGLGAHLQRQMESLGPQFEHFKTQTGVLVDELVLLTNNFMMDWVKKEKRE